MCFGRSPSLPPPPPLPPPPAPPVPPAPPIPQPEAVETDINPKVRQAKSKKARNPQTKGTGALRIPLNPSVNVGTAGQAGGLNK
tara:strand:+ start:288 stop:539 length:252 start_codon:yes stop_codon:yes gene_type:complete